MTGWSWRTRRRPCSLPIRRMNARNCSSRKSFERRLRTMLDPYVVVEYLPSLSRGLMVTILFTVASLIVGLVIGVIAAVFGLSRSRLLQWLGGGHVGGLPGTPVLL